MTPEDRTITVKIRVDARPFLRAVKAVDARVSNLDKPLSIPTAQELLMSQEFGEFDV